jgi:hypothetical protein
MRRLFLVVLGSAILMSACSASSPAASSAPTAAPTAASTTAPTAAPSVVAGPPDASWIVFVPDGAGFTGKIPATPKLTTQTYQTEVGAAPASLWSYEQSNDLAYFFLTANCPAGSMTGVAPGLIYDGAVDGMAGGSANLTVGTQTDTTITGHAGRVFELTGTTANIKGEIVIVGDNLFVVYVAYTPKITDFTPIDAFFADFQLKS